MGITPYPAKERVGNKVCPGTGHENFNPSTVDTERVQTGNKGNVHSTTQV